MKKQLTIPFQVTGWETEKTDEASNAPTLSRITVKKKFTGEIKGESIGDLLMCASADGAAGYTIMDRFFVEIGGRKGSFVAIHGGMTDEMKASGRIVPNSGTLEFKSDDDGKRIILDYEFIN